MIIINYTPMITCCYLGLVRRWSPSSIQVKQKGLYQIWKWSNGYYTWVIPGVTPTERVHHSRVGEGCSRIWYHWIRIWQISRSIRSFPGQLDIHHQQWELNLHRWLTKIQGTINGNISSIKNITTSESNWLWIWDCKYLSACY